ncbi:MAG TPA: hypothetical protein VGL39_07655 [Jatrophihabitantaceae bacterium]|jgi:hypothetical protein
MAAPTQGQIVFAVVSPYTNKGNDLAPAVVINSPGGAGPNYVCDAAVMRTGTPGSLNGPGELWTVTVYPDRATARAAVRAGPDTGSQVLAASAV